MSSGPGAAVLLSPVTSPPRPVDPREPMVRLEDQALTHGDGIFETLHVLDGTAYKFDAHHARLAASAAEHRTIAEALAARDGDLAAHATHVHLHNALTGILDSLESRNSEG